MGPTRTCHTPRRSLLVSAPRERPTRGMADQHCLRYGGRGTEIAISDAKIEGEAGGEGTHTKTGVRGEEEVGESFPAATTY